MQNIKYVFIILALSWVCYSNSFNSPFHYDDAVNIIHNMRVKITEITPDTIVGSMFAGGAKGDIYHPEIYRPLAMTSFALNHYFHGLEVFGYHVVNFCIHVTSALFLFLFIKLLLTIPALDGRYRKDSTLIALLASLFWAVHPVQLTSVTYVVQRMSSMAGMFYIMTMLFYLKGRMQNKWHFVTAGICSICAVMTKENAIMLYPCIWLFDVMFFERKNKALFIRVSIYSVVAMFLLVLAVSGPETFSFNKLLDGFAKRDFSLTERLLTEPRVVVFYIMLVLFPSHHLMSLTHNVPISHGLLDPCETSIAIVIITLIVAMAVMYRKKHLLMAYGIFFFFINHLIESTIFPLELVYEHRNYTPTMLVFIPVAAWIVYLSQQKSKVFAHAIVSSVLVFFCYNTYVQNDVWNSDLKLWTDTIKKSPDPRSMFNMGGAYYSLHDRKNALKYWTIASKYNELYGTNYKEGHDALPYGRVMEMAKHNSTMLWMEKEGRVRHAWSYKGDINKIAVIDEVDNNG